MTSAVFPQIWDAKKYNLLSIAQNKAFQDYRRHLRLKGNELILDVGCGDGKISSKIAKLIPNGNLIGIDISEEMISFAKSHYQKQHSNLNFHVQNAMSINYSSEFDVVFSSYVLQWVPDKHLFFTKVYTALRNHGTLAAIIPLHVSYEVEQAVSTIIRQNTWATFFQGFKPNWHFSNETYLQQMLYECCFEITYSETLIQEVFFTNRALFEDYLLLWFPYLNPIPSELQRLFFNQFVEEYLKLLPADRNGRVRMKIPRFDFTAVKSAF